MIVDDIVPPLLLSKKSSQILKDMRAENDLIRSEAEKSKEEISRLQAVVEITSTECSKLQQLNTEMQQQLQGTSTAKPDQVQVRNIYAKMVVRLSVLASWRRR